MQTQETTITRADITEVVYNKIGLSRLESGQLVDSVIDEMTKAILADDELKISNFGTFQKRHKKQRVGRNPKTGVEVPITERTVLVFKASQLLKKQMNEG